MGGENLFVDPMLRNRFAGIPRYWLYGLERRLTGPSALYSWLALAGALKDPVAQWTALRDPNLSKVDEIFGYLFYDPSVAAAPPVDPPGSVYWPFGHGQDVHGLGSRTRHPRSLPLRPGNRQGPGRPKRV